MLVDGEITVVAILKEINAKSGGGYIVDYLGASYTTVFEELQVYRLIT